MCSVVYKLSADVDMATNGSIIIGLLELKSGQTLANVAAKASWDNYKSFIKCVFSKNLKSACISW